MDQQLKPLALYVHVPFCKAKCTYCDFYSLAGKDSSIPSFLDALEIEMKSITADLDLHGYQVDSIFFGGGTPNMLTPSQLERILQNLQGIAPFSKGTEIGLEVNPGEASIEDLRSYIALGFNRISIGIQSFHQKLLTFMSRIHSVDQSVETIHMARQAGFENVSGDLIFAVPGQTNDMWEKDLKKLIDLEPNHISTYSLTVEEGTALKRWVEAGHVHMLEETVDTGMYARGRRILEAAKFQNYEVSNFSKPNYECRHNMNYWTGVEYLGFGPSAHSFFSDLRWWNPRDLSGYTKQLIQDGKCQPEIEKIDAVTSANETIMTRLRLNQGLNLSEFQSRYGVDLLSEQKTILDKWGGALEIADHHIKITPSGWDMIDEISPDLMIIK